jgi:hypothetical protein
MKRLFAVIVVLAVAMAQELSTGLGQKFIVDNRPSASSLVGSQLVAGAAPDGYMLLITHSFPTTLGILLTRVGLALMLRSFLLDSGEPARGGLLHRDYA